MRIKVYNKRDFERMMADQGLSDDNVDESPYCAFISIVGTQQGEESIFRDHHPHVLVLRFDDLEDTSEHGAGRLFDAEMAEMVVAFLQRNRDAHDLFVHCGAGISRSGAIATFANDLYRGDYFEFMADNPQVKPNATVLSALNRYNSSLSGQ